jgi:hypothetical protein
MFILNAAGKCDNMFKNSNIEMNYEHKEARYERFGYFIAGDFGEAGVYAAGDW